MYILNVIKTIYKILNREQKNKMLLMQLFFAFSAIMQVVGVASIAPFIGILSNPKSIHAQNLLSALYKLGEFQSDSDFIIGFALLSIVMIFISNGISAATMWVQLKFSINLGCSLQHQLFSNYISREYIFHKSTNYNNLIHSISTDAPRFIFMVLLPYLMLCSQGFVAFIILIGLVLIDPTIAFSSALLIGGAYLVTYWLIKKSLVKYGNIVAERARELLSLLSESFIGIKDLKLNALEYKYASKYLSTNRSGLNASIYLALTGDLPRFAIETISFCAILLFALILLKNNSSTDNVISILSIYAIAGYKLLPTMQQIYKSISSLSAHGVVVTWLEPHLNGYEPPVEGPEIKAMPEVKKISLHNIGFQYPNTQTQALKEITVTFEKGNINTIAGPSGSGKSTLADIILGLLPPAHGSISANDEILDVNKLASYQRSIGYVPQQIFILENDVIGNVAFGVDREKIDIEKVKLALIQANAMEFVTKLPEGLNTNLGQDGKLLSGGQRQRIGIARALYRNSKVLILDEPTSALDIESEHDFMNVLNTLKNDTLIIVISHRPAAIKLSDKISIIDSGELVADGNFAELFATNSHFQSMMEKGLMN